MKAGDSDLILPFVTSSNKSIVLKEKYSLGSHVFAVKDSVSKIEPRRDPITESNVIIAPTLEIMKEYSF